MAVNARLIRRVRWAVLAFGLVWLTTAPAAPPPPVIPLRGPPLDLRPDNFTVIPLPSTRPVVVSPNVAEMPAKPIIRPLNNGTLQPGFIYNIIDSNATSGGGGGGGGLGGGGLGGGGLGGGFGGGGRGGGWLGGGGGGGWGAGGRLGRGRRAEWSGGWVWSLR